VAAGLSPGNTWRFGPGAEQLGLRDIRTTAEGTSALLSMPDGSTAPIELGIPGVHNLRNATAAVGAVLALGGNPAPALAALAEFRGVGRRFERLGTFGGITIVDDYAHHPTELSATLAAARQAFPSRTLVAVFQPHLFSRTALHHQAMGAALAGADLAVISDVYPAREAPLPGVTGELVAESARRHGVRTVYQPARGALGRTVADLLHPGDVLLTLGAGDITHLGREVRTLLEAE